MSVMVASSGAMWVFSSQIRMAPYLYKTAKSVLINTSLTLHQKCLQRVSSRSKIKELAKELETKLKDLAKGSSLETKTKPKIPKVPSKEAFTASSNQETPSQGVVGLDTKPKIPKVPSNEAFAAGSHQETPSQGLDTKPKIPSKEALAAGSNKETPTQGLAALDTKPKIHNKVPKISKYSKS
jgi:hypothetical protein